jgi:hypothetical protein
MSQILNTVAVIGIDIGKNSFHVVGLDGDGALVLRQKWSRGQVEARLANMSPAHTSGTARSAVASHDTRHRAGALSPERDPCLGCEQPHQAEAGRASNTTGVSYAHYRSLFASYTQRLQGWLQSAHEPRRTKLVFTQR